MPSLWQRITGKRETAAAPGPVLRAWLLGDDYDTGRTVVNEGTALGIAAYFACIRNISEDIAKLPFRAYEIRKDGGREAIPDHPLLPLLNDCWNPYMCAMTGWETYVSHALGWQGGYAEIVRGASGIGSPVELWPVDPRKVKTVMDGGIVQHVIARDNGSQTVVDDSDLLVLHGLGFDGLTGHIVSNIGKQSIGSALAANQFRFSYFENGAVHSMVVTVPSTWSEQATKNFRDDLDKNYTGARKAHRAMILEAGATASPASSDPDKSQLVETMQFNVEDVCRWFRMPPNKVQHLLRSTFNNIEEDNRNYVIDTLQSWSRRLCQEIKRKLLPESARNIAFDHDFGILLEADMEKRIAATLTEFQMGMWTPNELLKRSNRKPIGEIGDKRFVMSGLQTLDTVGQVPEQPEPIAVDSAGEGEETDADRGIDVQKACAKVFAEDFKRWLRIEQDKARRAAVRGELAEWMNKFYPGHEQQIAKQLESRMGLVLIACGGNPDHARDISKEMAREYVEESQLRLLKMSRAEAAETSDRFANMMAARSARMCANGTGATV